MRCEFSFSLTAIRHLQALGRDHPWTKEGQRPRHCRRARCAWLYREAKALPKPYGVTSSYDR